MGIWIFMTVMLLLIPVVMIGFGQYFKKNSPTEINDLFGYRTSMSKKNRETWEFAHKMCGKVWSLVGWITLPLTVIPMLFLIGKDQDTIGLYGTVICIIQTIILIGTIYPVEKALKKRFDKNGNRIN